MSAIESCRTAALGGHVARCEKCAHTHIAYNSCRNRHCPKCQGAAAKEWLADREAELLPVPYYHVVFHRIRHYGLFANGGRADNIARARQLLNVPTTQRETGDDATVGDSEPQTLSHPCPCCGGRMIVIETFERGCVPRYRPTLSIRIDTS